MKIEKAEEACQTPMDWLTVCVFAWLAVQQEREVLRTVIQWRIDAAVSPCRVNLNVMEVLS